MVAEVELSVSEVVVAIAGQQLAFAAALEAAAGDDIEHSVSPIAEFRGVASALDLEVVDVLRVKLRTDIAGDIRIWHRHAVNCPGDLMPTAYVQLIVNHVRTRHKVGDHRHAVGSVGSGTLRDVRAGDECFRSG